MSDAHRDDLEAALARASDLEREIEELRRRNAELEAGGQTDEARENARRLAAAIEREQKEAQIRDERKLDEASWRRAARNAADEAAAEASAAAAVPRIDSVFADRAVGVAFLTGGAILEIVGMVAGSSDASICAVVLFVFGILLVISNPARKRR
jgi:hypothetical protein